MSTAAACKYDGFPGRSMAPDTTAFAAAFSTASDSEGVITYRNLGGDALLVAPCPVGPAYVYPHLAAFVRGAPAAQRHELSRKLAEVTEQCLSELWISISGLGVYWLHIRLDSPPKYYTFQPHTRAI
ncbi:MAG: DUF6940 family protein [Gammaproteobacteria bacterium]